MKINTKQIASSAKRTFRKLSFHISRKSPEILLGVGITSGIGAAVWACAQTRKLDDVIEQTQDELTEIHANLDDLPEVSDVDPQDVKKELRKEIGLAYCRCAGRLVKLYGGPVLLGTGAVTSLLVGHNILNKRYIERVVAFNALMATYNESMARVRDKYGEDAEREIRYGLTPETVTETVVDEDGKKHKEKHTVFTDPADPRTYSMYAVRYDSKNTEWFADTEKNYYILKMKQQMLNDRLHMNYHLFLNEVLDELGFPKLQAGQNVGWIWDPNFGFEDYVDFRITPVIVKSEDGDEEAYILDFNCHDIYNDFVKHQDY